MQTIFTKDDAAPDAIGAQRWLEDHLGVKNLYFDVIFKSPVSLKLHAGDGDWHIFQHKDVLYVFESSCGVYETVATATADEVRQLIDGHVSVLVTPKERPKHRTVKSFEAQYFRSTGKYHTGGKFDLEVTVLEGGTIYMQDVVDFLKAAQQDGTLPGLMRGCGQEYSIYISHADGYPVLIPALK